MAEEAPIKQNAKHVTFRYTIKDQDGDVIDLSSATTKDLLFKPKGFPVKRFTGSFPSGDNGTQGRIEYKTTATTDLEHGVLYRVTADIVIANVYEGQTSIDEFNVQPLIAEQT